MYGNVTDRCQIIACKKDTIIYTQRTLCVLESHLPVKLGEGGKMLDLGVGRHSLEILRKTP
jgi:hypothetical protein